jgi:hypothetical protein
LEGIILRLTIDEGNPWYHGSNRLFEELETGSTVTQWEALAKAFSHKPPMLSIFDDGTILHNGKEPGYLYQIDEPVSVGMDVYPHPRTTMEANAEFLTKKPLRVKLVEQLASPADTETITMCGYRCDLCKAYAGNIQSLDERQALSDIWRKYYDLDIRPEDMWCDGCRCMREDARRIDMACPVRACVLKKQINSCRDCGQYPCEVFRQREGLSIENARVKLGERFCEKEYETYLLAFDNRTRLDRIGK